MAAVDGGGGGGGESPFFTGSVEEAVRRCRASGRSLLVAVHADETDHADSARQAAVWLEPEVRAKLLAPSTGVVALKLLAASPNGQFFRQLFPVDVFPTTVFLSYDGKRLGSLAGFHPAARVLKHLRLLEAAFKRRREEEAKGTGDGDAKEEEEAPAAAAEDETPAEPALELHAGMHLSDKRLSLAQKKELLRLKVAANAAKKKKEAEENARESERKRRDTAKAAAELSVRQKEIKERQAAEQVKKDRARRRADHTKAAARLRAEREERIREREREERDRKARAEAEAKAAKAAKAAKPKPEGAGGSEPKVEAGAGAQAEEEGEDARAWLAFRLTNGDNVPPVALDPSATLGEAVERLAALRTDGHGPFVLVTAFPHRTYTRDDLGSTLVDLALGTAVSLRLRADSSAAAISTAAASGGGGGGGRGGGPCGCVRRVLGFLVSLSPFTIERVDPAKRQALRGGSGGGGAAGGGAGDSSGPAQRFGSIHTLRQRGGGDSNEYWNGNSTATDGGDGGDGGGSES